MEKAMTLQKRAIAFLSAVILAISMTCVVPFAAYATDTPESSGYKGTITATGQTAEVVIGDTITMTAAETGTAQFRINTQTSGDHHVDYAIENADGKDTGAATINKHSGVLTPSSAGTVTVTAYLLDCAQPSGVQGAPCYDDRVISSVTKTVTITEGEEGVYGWQGNSLQIKLDNDDLVSSVSVIEDGGYVNTLNTTFAVNSNVTISYSQNYGIGNQTIQQYEAANDGKITLINKSTGAVVRTLGSDISMSLTDSSVKTGITLSFDTANLSQGNYSLVFDSEYVAGNGSSELGVQVVFDFELV